MNDVIECGHAFGWQSDSSTQSDPDCTFNGQVKTEYLLDDDVFGVDKSFKPQLTVPTAPTDTVAATLQTAFYRKPPNKEMIATFNPALDFIKDETNENFAPYTSPAYENEASAPSPANCGNDNNCDNQNMDIYRELILRHLIQDINTTCHRLGLPTDPYVWSGEHGSRWISEMCQQFSLNIPVHLYLTGRQLLGMSQKDFVIMAPDGGDTLFAQLQLWKTAFEKCQQQGCSSGSQANILPPATDRNAWINSVLDQKQVRGDCQQPQFGMNNGNVGNIPFANATATPSFMTSGNDSSAFFNADVMLSPSNSDMSSSASMHDMNEDDCLDIQLNMFNMQRQGVPFGTQHMMNNLSKSPDGQFPRHSGTVHLWHFIRELLDQPKQYGSCVRWVDRDEGTFKIESSHHLARFWGQRKNRSQMNYDKLSRSLRQYYKKGIIQKPEKKQRLVYKFLPPYNL